MNRVKIIDESQNVYLETGLSIIPERWSYASDVGFHDALIRVEGRVDDLYTVIAWLGNTVQIQNKFGTDVWEGKIVEVTINVGNAAIGVSLKSMYNKVRVLYSTMEEGGTLTAQQTAWREDLNSQLKYGVRELIYTQSNLDTTAADTLAQTLANDLGMPRGEMSFDQTDYFATLRCEGLLSTMNWKYHIDETGFEGNVSGSSEQPIGLGFTTAETGFDSEAGLISAINARWINFPNDSKFKLSGSASNNGTKTITGVTRGAQVVYTASTISFDPADDMNDSANGFDNLRSGQLIKIVGSVGAANDGYYWVKSVSEGHITLDPSDIVTTAAASTTITQGNSVTIAEPVTNEISTATITVTAHGQRLYYSFQIASSVAWTVSDVYLKLKKVGAPADNVSVSLIQMTGVDTYTTLTTVTKAGSLIGTDFGSYRFTMPSPQTFNPGTTYGILVQRTGGNSHSDFFIAAIDEEENHGGTLRLYDGAAWNDRYIQGDLWFSIQGTKTTTVQMAELLASHAQHINSYSFEQASSGVSTAQYMTKEEVALERFKKLLGHGNSLNQKYVVESIVGGAIKIAIQKNPATQSILYRIDSSGRVLEGQGQELEPGRLLQNEVVEVSLDMIPNGTFLLANRFNVGSCEWDENQQRLTITPASASSSRSVEMIANR